MAGCNIPCIQTSSLDAIGNLIMISTAGNTKYPQPHTPHPRCPECAAAAYAEVIKEIKKLKDAAAQK